MSCIQITTGDSNSQQHFRLVAIHDEVSELQRTCRALLCGNVVLLGAMALITIVLNMCDVLLKCVDLRKFSGSIGTLEPGLQDVRLLCSHSDLRLSAKLIGHVRLPLSRCLSVFFFCFCTFFNVFS